ncbi:MAG TPA: thioredoxin family protein [Sedimenticola thiotaurini]|uniref:Thioredoxin family protein n=1 Tax=Sedimenticola thiotaurini TaxID=1543721 RepID=A0A831W9C4_9GAMM|nr:thioredoxin family protein [Sedimenticola thiotaurini]
MAIAIEVFSAPGCGKCGQAKQVLKKLVDALDDGRLRWREVNILEEMDYAVELGVLSTPAIAIDRQLVFTGLPSERQLQAELQRRLAEQP